VIVGFVKNLLLNYPAKTLPGGIYLKLLITYSWILRLIGHKSALKSASIEGSSGTVSLEFFNGDDWLIVNPVRVNRYLKGITHAGSRMLKRYHLDSLDTQPNTFVDVGANVGELSYWFAQKGCKVLAFEPDPKVYVLLQRNLEGFKNVKIANEALSDIDAQLRFSVKSDSADSSLVIGQDDLDTVIVEAIRYENHAFSEEVIAPAYLKMDTEGSEPESLRGFGAKLSQFAFVAIDAGLERLGESTRDEVERLLENSGFKLKERKSDYIVNALR
jgi:FkbM family methyltransferase